MLDLRTFAKERREEISENDIANIMKQIFQVLTYLKAKNIVHRDIKEDNILINPQNLHIKLIDFGGREDTPKPRTSVLVDRHS